jgi:diguanylate cyclase
MAVLTNPTDIARETLKLLSQRRLVPTPENYQKIYCEIGGVAPEAQKSETDDALIKALQNLAKKSPALGKRTKALEKVVSDHDLPGFEAGLMAFAGGDAADQPWGELIRELLKQWQVRHKGINPKRKQEGLERVLINFASDPAVLHQKIRALVSSWGSGSAQGGVEVAETAALEEQAAGEIPSDGAPISQTGRPMTAKLNELAADVDELMQQMRGLLAQALEHGVAPRLMHFPELSDEATALANKAREAREPKSIEALTKALKQFWFKLEVSGENDADVLAGLLRLLKLLIDNIGELLIDDQWLRGQIAVVQDVITSPVNSRALFEAERSFKEVIFKQGALKHSLNEAKATLKNMVTTFIDRLGDMSESTGEYHGKIEAYAVRITQTEDMNLLNDILADLAMDTRGMQLNMQRTRDELLVTRKQVEEAETKILELETELEAASEKVREDHLTGTLNRRGLNDAMEREFARSDRNNTPLCLAMLDLDYFKKLNDTYGHQAGDEALLHLVKVVKEIVRPTDVVARFGGEEFVILLPETDLDEAVRVMTRLQRELTKKFFLHKNERVLITFSAGVALRGPGEAAEAFIGRADSAVYKAKESGRNRVVAAE